jgi:hypothetical protein
LEDLRGRLTQPAFDLAEIWVTHTGLARELAERDLRGAALVPDEVTKITNVQSRHVDVDLLITLPAEW